MVLQQEQDAIDASPANHRSTTVENNETYVIFETLGPEDRTCEPVSLLLDSPRASRRPSATTLKASYDQLLPVQGTSKIVIPDDYPIPSRKVECDLNGPVFQLWGLKTTL